MKNLCKFIKEFFRLVRLGVSPLALGRNCITDKLWRAAVLSGNGELYIEGGL